MAQIGPHLPRLALLLLLAGPVIAATPGQMFSALSSAPTETDLPLTTSGDAASFVESRRPATSYPTLRLDARDERTAQLPEAPLAVPNTTANSNFARLVEQSLGKALPIFGSEMFRNNVRGFEPVEVPSVPGDFVIGPGDEIHIRAWGSVDIDFRTTVDRTGAINLPKIGVVPVSGVRFDRLEAHIRASMERSFHGFDLTVSLGQLRSIRIYVTGFAAAPGSYTVSALSNTINALFHAGGPGTAGDLRAIELHRDGRLLHTIDFYDFLLSGTLNTDIRLMPEDVVHFPSTVGEFAVAGAVNRPGIYQMRAGETIEDALRFAGDLGVGAAEHRAVIERIDEDGNRVVDEFPLDAAALNMPIRDGDLLLIQPVSPRFRNAITLRGQVAQPLRHEWSAGMRVSDLLPSADALVSPLYWNSLNMQDQAAKLVKNKANADFDPDSPEINWEFATIERIDPQTLDTVLLPFNLAGAVIERSPEHDIELQPGDTITVFSLRDFRTRRAQKQRFVSIEGEVGRAGYYPVESGATLADLIEQAGGLTGDAYLFGLELRRESVRRQQRLRIDEAIDQLEQDYQRHLIDRSRNVLSGDMSLAIPPEAAAIERLISKLRQAEPSGRIVLELPGDIGAVADLPVLALNDGDTIFIPPTPATTEVIGAVYRQGSFLHSDRSVKSYVEKAGLLPTAHRRQIYVIRPDGSFAEATRRMELFPGDTIIVPEKTDRETTVRRLKDWTQILYQFGLGAAGLSLLGVF